MAQAEAPYPVQFSVEYPDRDLDRLSTAFRIFTVIPIAIVLAAISGGPDVGWAERDASYAGGISAGGILFLAPLLMIVFRQKYPRWWFDWNLNLVRFENRVFSYLFLLRDEYPSGDPPLHRAALLGTRRVRGNHHRLVRDTLYWALPSRAVRFRGRSDALGQPRPRLCLRVGHRSLSAVPAESVVKTRAVQRSSG